MQKNTDQIIENAEVLWQENGAPYSNRFADIYFSRQGGPDETEHVFITANDLVSRWQELDSLLSHSRNCSQRQPSNTFTVAELGFGTGLNFLCCWQAWHKLAPSTLRLHYIACEKYPMQLSALQQVLASWPDLQNFSISLISAYLDHSPGYHRLHLTSQDKHSEVVLDLYYGDAAELLAAQPNRRDVKVDAWFLDGFAPRVNPDMWSPALMQVLATLSRYGTTLSTYSVAGQVVSTLQACGFEVSKQTGFGQKRHMLRGKYVANSVVHPVPQRHSWMRIPEHSSDDHAAVVIGAGLAGCSTAYALAKRGYRVTVLEQNEDSASGASGNRQAVLQCRVNNAVNAAWQFNLQAFLYSARHFAAMQELHPEIQWHACGVLNLDTAFRSRMQRCAEVRLDLYSPQVARRISKTEATAITGIDIDGGGNFLPLGGWLNPAALCRAYLRHPRIQFVGNAEAEFLIQENNCWTVFSPEHQVLASASTLIIANSFAARRFSQTAELPLVPLRGQVSYVNESRESRALNSVVCGLSYLSPSFDSLHSAGASYSKDVSDLTLSHKEHADNVSGINLHLPEGALLESAIAGGRVSVRAGTGDRMPMAGPVPDFKQLRELYDSAGHRDRKFPPAQPTYQSGLYISVGHGSHGLSNCPLAAEYLASLVNNEPSPLQLPLVECLHPARFLLRELRKQPNQR
ncbi:MAG: bifunctional tRNA (5-methylaminomethyl-2-thiouridine)(34)-methyltransferase MnmD/FAD-dependent 5-carboxymethylaminomethyl-2-thiouridine(34) oxidoreductase MnmC [Gammaproteobacteria bacterium]|nr:bifunctional tRNA (5-methylaminomethyl-2-thiouridine)(34)-methyltransferase MnmD/FAD-dependent 5-carboxymethylaminomethyl-2-thiouridine(34) oxidoreductase MnmC [Gammaproteobacteria bacterium]MDP2139292.1 bifunctional tRNA (5-methylaminomethyl-2-thiouridine)(34)-methyltransferase MnmD/FAD-dependent 5-carboxymethylaminomethyl-2-thiouridine(34) oxidoreductase MnmC [Gammaproteobacteria bacterium]MDP2346777.1 bifunctional tRNA (5-methylaminomethyl-2-thiouridine)(34)-methyltransferase MnmD/FAD-depen